MWYSRLFSWHRTSRMLVSISLMAAMLIALSGIGLAMIRGDKGNKPIHDPGWPQGAAEIFNCADRIAWWEGPPLGGGQWHAEFQGNDSTLNEVLVQFARIDAPVRRLIVHDGVGSSFWLDPNRQHQGEPKVEMDWEFIVWQTDRENPQQPERARWRIGSEVSAAERAIPIIHLYTGGAIQWQDVRVPDGIEVVDNRLERHGFSLADGRVIEGTVKDSESGQGIAAQIRLQQISSNPMGGYLYDELVQTVADENGHFVLRNVPAKWCQLIVSEPGYASRIAHYGQYTDQPGWERVDTELAKSSMIDGRVVDQDGKPIAEVDVRLDHPTTKGQLRYELAPASEVKTDAMGRFRLPSIVDGTGSVWIHRQGYVRPGLGPEVQAPSSDLELQMVKSSSVRVRVSFPKGSKPHGYLVKIADSRGEVAGTWGGSGNIDAEGMIQFRDMPPGNYSLWGRPNPGSDDEQTKEYKIAMVGGEELEIEIVPISHGTDAGKELGR